MPSTAKVHLLTIRELLLVELERWGLEVPTQPPTRGDAAKWVRNGSPITSIQAVLADEESGNGPLKREIVLCMIALEPGYPTNYYDEKFAAMMIEAGHTKKQVEEAPRKAFATLQNNTGRQVAWQGAFRGQKLQQGPDDPADPGSKWTLSCFLSPSHEDRFLASEAGQQRLREYQLAVASKHSNATFRTLDAADMVDEEMFTTEQRNSLESIRRKIEHEDYLKAHNLIEATCPTCKVITTVTCDTCQRGSGNAGGDNDDNGNDGDSGSPAPSPDASTRPSLGDQIMQHRGTNGQ